MARRGLSSDAVSYKTNVTSIAFSKVMMEDMVMVMNAIKQYTNRSDFVIYAVRRFNEYTLKHILDSSVSGSNSLPDARNKTIEMRENMIIALEAYYETDPNLPNFPYKITYSITDDLKNYISLLNQNSWKFDSIQTYIRVAIIRLIEEYRVDRNKIMARSNILGQDFVSFTCPIGKRGSDNYEEGELMIDHPNLKGNNNEEDP